MSNQEQNCDPCAPKFGCTSQPLPPATDTTTVSPTSVEFSRSGAAACVPADTSNLSEFLQWLETNVVSLYCNAQGTTGQIVVSDGTTLTVQSLQQAIIDVLGLTAANPHIVFDGTTLVAGEVQTNVVDCATLTTLFQNCIANAAVGSVPTQVIGFVDVGGTPTAQKFNITTVQPTRLIAELDNGVAANVMSETNDSTSTFINGRSTPIDSDGTITLNQMADDGSTYNNANTAGGSVYTFNPGVNGVYHLNLRSNVEIAYAGTGANSGAEFRIELWVQRTGTNALESVIPLDSEIVHFDIDVDQTVYLSGSTTLNLEAGQYVVPVIVNESISTDPANNLVHTWTVNNNNPGSFSATRVIDSEVQIIG